MRTAASAFMAGVWFAFLLTDVLYCCGVMCHPDAADFFLDVFWLSLMAFIAYRSITGDK